ncbi:MAG: 3-deoxy-7-phosphoheptulonate synthase [Phycisphaerae bacterium]|nr:3-deoxy-7-phosphoheptulonate synthase [Phycisphaerae bacterium]
MPPNPPAVQTHAAPGAGIPAGGTTPSADATATPRPSDPATTATWTPESWKSRRVDQAIDYPDAAELDQAVARLAALPPLVTSGEIERLKRLIADAQEGRRFFLQAGDCAETLDDCRSESITNKLKILLQMSMVIVQGLKVPVVRVGRFAGQYAKPRSCPTEARVVDGREVILPSYFGDLVNHASFDEKSRRPDPELLVKAYQHAAITLNFIRSLVDGGFADVHHPEYWDLSFFSHASLSPARRAEYERMRALLSDGLRFMEALGERSVGDLARMEFFTSHEGLNLHWEAAQTRRVPRRAGWYNLTAHMPWIGERTRALDGAHIEYFRGIENPLGIKIGPSARPHELLALLDRLNPRNQAGKIALVTRMGADRIVECLPPLVETVTRAGRRVLWVCDPMHGNGIKTAAGIKTRSFDAILHELEACHDVHRAAGSVLGGVHFELTGEDVTECVGGAAGVTEQHLTQRYSTLCDPRLNYQQSLELAFLLARKMGKEQEPR